MEEKHFVLVATLSGVILGWALNLSQNAIKRARKVRGHRRVISKIFNKYIGDLYNPDAFFYGGPLEDIDSRRWQVFVKLESEIDTELSRRNSKININDERAIREAFELMREAASNLSWEPGPDMELYEEFFLKQLRENRRLRWLGIPDKKDKPRPLF